MGEEFTDTLIQWMGEGKIPYTNLFWPHEIYTFCKDNGYNIFVQLTADPCPLVSEHLVIDPNVTSSDQAIEMLKDYYDGALYRVQVSEYQPPVFCPYKVSMELYRNLVGRNAEFAKYGAH